MSKTHGQPVSYASSYTVNSVTWMKNVHAAIYHESLEGPVVGVQKHTGHRANLSRPIPAIRAMNQDTDPFLCHGLCACHVRTWNQYRSKSSCMGWLSKRSFTLDMKIPASMIDLMCLNQSEFSRPKRNSLMVGERSAETKKKKKKWHFEKIQTNSPQKFIYDPVKRRWWKPGALLRIYSREMIWGILKWSIFTLALQRKLVTNKSVLFIYATWNMHCW